VANDEGRAVRQQRLGRNQALFREVNERVNDVNDLLTRRAPVDEWVCECANEACFERIPLTHDEYEAIRAVSTRFAVAPQESHVFVDVEEVVARNERYWVVEKIEAGAAVAEQFDPRARAGSPE
jgi:hypothetical protein